MRASSAAVAVGTAQGAVGGDAEADWDFDVAVAQDENNTTELAAEPTVIEIDTYKLACELYGNYTWLDPSEASEAESDDVIISGQYVPSFPRVSVGNSSSSGLCAK